MRSTRTGVALALMVSSGFGQAWAGVTFSASGGSASDIQSTVDAFRSSLGGINANVAGSFGSGRREINWDGVPDARSAPNNLPFDFFNVNSPRGAVFSTPGSAVQVSAKLASGVPVRFDNIDGTYSTLFSTFSPERLFTALGSNVVDVRFFVPGSTAPALTRGFGAVFTDGDLADTSSITFFGLGNSPLGTFFVSPDTVADGGLSFLGVEFGSAVVSRVRIVSGNTALGGPEAGGADLVVMDDFLYGEPVGVPAPGAGAVRAGLLGLFLVRRRSGDSDL